MSLPGKGWNSRESTGTPRPAGNGRGDWRMTLTIRGYQERIFTDVIKGRFPGYLTNNRGVGMKSSLTGKGGEE